MGLDILHLRVLATSSEDLKQRRNAQKGLQSHREIDDAKLKLKGSLGIDVERETLGSGGARHLILGCAYEIELAACQVLLLCNVVRIRDFSAHIATI